jgi:hypothetical protein
MKIWLCSVRFLEAEKIPHVPIHSMGTRQERRRVPGFLRKAVQWSVIAMLILVLTGPIMRMQLTAPAYAEPAGKKQQSGLCVGQCQDIFAKCLDGADEAAFQRERQRLLALRRALVFDELPPPDFEDEMAFGGDVFKCTAAFSECTPPCFLPPEPVPPPTPRPLTCLECRNMFRSLSGDQQSDCINRFPELFIPGGCEEVTMPPEGTAPGPSLGGTSGP